MHTNAQTPRLLVIATLLLPMFLSMPAQAQQEKKASIITYPVPDLAACTNLKRSVAYTLRVGASVADTEVFVYALSGFGKDGKPGNDGVGVAFSAFAFSGGPVKVELTSISTNAIKSAEVWPLEFGIKPTVDGQKVAFTLTETRKVMVVLNGGPCLSLFADPPETDVPTAQTPGVIYYGPGVHELGRNYVEIPSKTLSLIHI